MENKNDLSIDVKNNEVENINVDENVDLIEKRKERRRQKKIITTVMIIVPLLIAILSFAVFSEYAASAKLHSDTINALQEKQNTVLKISATSATIAAGASLLLGDRANAVSSKLLDLTGYFVIILCAIMLEKYLVTVMGLVSFKVLIPIACIIFSVFTMYNRNSFRKFAIRIFVFALAMFFIIPISVNISGLIESTYNEANLQQMISEGDTLKAELDKEIGNINDNVVSEEISRTVNEIDAEKATNEQNTNEGAQNFFSNIGKGIVDTVSGAKDKAVEAISGAVAVVTDKANKLIDKLTTQLNKTIETIAVMLVTTCVIPILVIIFFIWIIKMLFSVEINVDIDKLPKLSKMVRKK